MLETPMSRFRLGTYLRFEKIDNKLTVKVKPEVEAHLKLPNLERRWSIFIDSSRFEDLPGVDPTERKNNLDIGLQNVQEGFHLHSSLGLRWRGEPVGIAKTEWRPSHSIGQTTIYPRQRLFYETQEGFGEITSLTLNRWYGKNFARIVSAGKWTEHTTGIEWEQTVILGRACRLIEENKQTDIATDEDVAKGISIRYSVFGHNSTSDRQIDRHRLTLIYRHPIYRNWIFFQIEPGVEWLDEDDWTVIPSVQIGIDTLFREVAKK